MISSSGSDRSIALIEAMIAYVRTGSALGELAAAHSAESAKLRLVCISILDWLGSRGRVPKMIAMSMTEAGSARDALISLVTNVAPFSLTFQIENDELKLHSSIDDEAVKQLLAAAAQLKPPRFVTRK